MIFVLEAIIFNMVCHLIVSYNFFISSSGALECALSDAIPLVKEIIFLRLWTRSSSNVCADGPQLPESWRYLCCRGTDRKGEQFSSLIN